MFKPYLRIGLFMQKLILKGSDFFLILQKNRNALWGSRISPVLTLTVPHNERFCSGLQFLSSLSQWGRSQRSNGRDVRNALAFLVIINFHVFQIPEVRSLLLPVSLPQTHACICRSLEDMNKPSHICLHLFCKKWKVVWQYWATSFESSVFPGKVGSSVSTECCKGCRNKSSYFWVVVKPNVF